MGQPWRFFHIVFQITPSHGRFSRQWVTLWRKSIGMGGAPSGKEHKFAMEKTIVNK